MAEKHTLRSRLLNQSGIVRHEHSDDSSSSRIRPVLTCQRPSGEDWGAAGGGTGKAKGEVRVGEGESNLS